MCCGGCAVEVYGRVNKAVRVPLKDSTNLLFNYMACAKGDFGPSFTGWALHWKPFIQLGCVYVAVHASIQCCVTPGNCQAWRGFHPLNSDFMRGPLMLSSFPSPNARRNSTVFALLMAELALGAIGVVPVVEFVFKSFKGLYKNLKTFKKYDREAKRVRGELKILRTVFLPTADDSNAPDIADHASRRSLGKLQLDQRLRRALGENYDACEKATAVIREDLEELSRELQDVTLFRASWRHSTKIAEDLGPSEEKLGEPKRYELSVEGKTCERYLMEWRGLVSVQRASRALHEALVDAWKCGHADHTRHLFRLFVETSQVEDQTQMRLTIIYLNRIQVALESRLVQLHVRSSILQLDLGASMIPLIPPDEEHQGMSKRRKIVRFGEPTVAEGDARDDEEIRCNIKCRPQWSLGVALLQINHWRKIDLGDVLAVRRAAGRTSQISPKYRELTQWCLECDFGRRRGQDLSRSPLHQAVYKVVLGELDRLLSLKEQEMSPMQVSDEGDELGYYNAFDGCTV
ncbi:uncharacterized protein NECHADRAFT_87434 [Fusarium vanettenii 77-13-4]|uniref:Uncharacterized protein n=1 Tax=Fusarium vanettenii (strain ATCC MYA-4622 / CBS 123669 / FGSC 9596 / NRRL 45880 / 77-13-4) TaxID=660122 RepID=C7ZEF4_FUSV7|nr:uncharacterized protein NECHADRAFT_87434 [Fusarium vanettenii 77-13-4]EEU37667.1 predicted protein [Fusarium vanettenii 77-13-4]